VARTTAQLATWHCAPLDNLDLVALLIDGVHLGDHCLIVALGIRLSRLLSPKPFTTPVVANRWATPYKPVIAEAR
jgi:hypothetical protein